MLYFNNASFYYFLFFLALVRFNTIQRCILLVYISPLSLYTMALSNRLNNWCFSAVIVINLWPQRATAWSYIFSLGVFPTNLFMHTFQGQKNLLLYKDTLFHQKQCCYDLNNYPQYSDASWIFCVQEAYFFLEPVAFFNTKVWTIRIKSCHN